MKLTAPALAFLALAACDDTPGEYSAIVYADAGDRDHYVTTRGFQSLSMCRQAAAESIAALPDPRKADYRCGYRCEVDPANPGLNRCQSMLR